MTSAESKFNETRAEYLREMRTITIAEFIEMTNISRRTFFKTVRPSLPVIRMGPRKIAIPLSAAIAWLENRTEVMGDSKDEEEEFYDEDDE